MQKIEDKKLFKIKDVLVEIIRRAGIAVMGYYQSNYQIKEKESDAGPVTQADLAAERIILQGLQGISEMEGVAFLSEESPDNLDRLEKEWVWIIDSLDGTKDFIDETGEFSILVGLVKAGQPVLAVIYKPSSDQLYWAVQGKGAYLEEAGKQQVLRVSEEINPSRFVLLESRNHPSEVNQRLINELRIGKVRLCGSVGVKVGLIARGEAHLNVNTSNKTWEWDVCAADLILREAGGKLTDLEGNDFIYNKLDPRNYRGYVASSGGFHLEIIRIIQEAGKI